MEFSWLRIYGWVCIAAEFCMEITFEDTKWQFTTKLVSITSYAAGES
jgi:hypothetical protein